MLKKLLKFIPLKHRNEQQFQDENGKHSCLIYESWIETRDEYNNYWTAYCCCHESGQGLMVLSFCHAKNIQNIKHDAVIYTLILFAKWKFFRVG